MSETYIYLFGQFYVQKDGQVVAELESDTLQKLFSYLLLYRQSAHARESLASLLWPATTTEQAKKRLRQALWRLQSALDSRNESPPDRLLLITTDRVQINPEADFWLDVAVFEQTFAIAKGTAGQQLPALHAQTLHNALHLYRGPLLEDCYEDWCLRERERLQNIYIAILEKLMSYYEEQHDYETGINYGIQLLTCDRTHERAYRRLMRLHYLTGDRVGALRLYEQCSRALGEELGAKPSQRTTAFYKQLLAEHLVVPEPVTTSTETQGVSGEVNTPSLVETLHCLTHLQEDLTGIQRRLQRCALSVEHSLRCKTSDSSLP